MLLGRLALHACSASQRSSRAATASLCIAAASLPSRPLPYRGVLLDFTAEEPPVNFADRLAPSMERWQAEGIKSAMLKLPIEHAGLATVAAGHGFSFHHVPLDADGQSVVLKKWLQPTLEDKVPPFATHQVGIAGLCIDDENRLLVVKEWSDVKGGGRVPSAQWKLPGGLLDAGETFAEAAVRETFEETGVRTRFRSLLSFWHRHGLTWGKSDLYYVARLEPASAAEAIALDPEEISGATPPQAFTPRHASPRRSSSLPPSPDTHRTPDASPTPPSQSADGWVLTNSCRRKTTR